MSTATLNPVQKQTAQPSSILMKRWTVDEYHNLSELGMFEGQRTHLVDGIILEEGPMRPEHCMVIEKLPFVVNAALGPGWRIRCQIPLPLNLSTDPWPDQAVIAGPAPAQPTHPTTANLVIEVSDTTLVHDSTNKMSLYAAAGIVEYWIIDIINNQLIVHRDPQPDTTQVHGHSYANVNTIPATGSVNPLAISSAIIRVQDMLP